MDIWRILFICRAAQSHMTSYKITFSLVIPELRAGLGYGTDFGLTGEPFHSINSEEQLAAASLSKSADEFINF